MKIRQSLKTAQKKAGKEGEKKMQRPERTNRKKRAALQIKLTYISITFK